MFFSKRLSYSFESAVGPLHNIAKVEALRPIYRELKVVDVLANFLSIRDEPSKLSCYIKTGIMFYLYARSLFFKIRKPLFLDNFLLFKEEHSTCIFRSTCDFLLDYVFIPQNITISQYPSP